MSLKALYAKLLILAAALQLLAACSSDSYEPTTDNPSDVYLTLEVSVAEPVSTAGSRAQGDTTYFKLPDIRCEKLNTLRVIILNASSGLIEENRMVTVDENGSIVNDNLTFKTKPGKKRILLFGNESVLAPATLAILRNADPGTAMDLDIVNELLMTRSGSDALYNWEGRRTDAENGVMAVPMSESWEVKVDELNENAENRYQTAKLFITRAVTKFSFTVSKQDNIPEGQDYSLANHEIVSFTINSIGFEQYLIPRAVYSEEIFEEGIDEAPGRLITSFTVPADATSPAAFTFTPASAMDVDGLALGNTYMFAPLIYLPETDLTKFSCSLTVRDKITNETQTLPVSQELPNLPSLPRNTHVIVNILLTPGQLKCTVDVVPYTSVELKPTFGFDELLPRPIPQDPNLPPWITIDPEEE